MKKLISVFLVLQLLIPFALFAETTEDNLQIAKDQTLDALKELQETKVAGAAGEAYIEKGSAYSEYETSGLGPDYYKKTAMSPYTKSKIGQGLAGIAVSAAAAVGTTMQDSAVKQLIALASDLNASGVPEYQVIAASLEKEAKYIEAGDAISAKNIANEITNYTKTKMPVDPNYKPTKSEEEALNPFAQFFKGFFSSILSVLSSQAVAALGAALGTIFGPIGSALGASVGGVISSIVNSLISNTPIDPENLGSAVAGGVPIKFEQSAGTLQKPGSAVQPLPTQGGAENSVLPTAKDHDKGKAVVDTGKKK